MIVIPSRFNGPPASANGGYACGVAAALIDGPAEVTLREPPPLDTPLEPKRDGERVLLVQDGRVVIEARPATLATEPPPFVDLQTARAAELTDQDFPQHVFPTCFTCGPARAPGDGLRIFTGFVTGTDLMAATWTPDPSLSDDDEQVALPVMWAALDCPSGWSAIHSNATGDTMLLGRMTARVLRRAHPGEQVVVTARTTGSEGRKHHATSALYAATGELLAHAEATWITLRKDPHA